MVERSRRRVGNSLKLSERAGSRVMDLRVDFIIEMRVQDGEREKEE